MKKPAFILLFFFFFASPALCAGSFYTPAMSLDELKQGNLRFLGEKPLHPRQGREERRQSLPGGQHPKALIISCVDARVPVEVIFDQGIGDVSVLRVPGNTAGRDVQIGIRQAIGKLQVPLVVVLGHTDCESVNDVCAGESAELLPDIARVARKVKKEEPELAGREHAFRQRVVLRNVQNSIDEILDKQPGIAELIASNSLTVVGAVYDLESGRVTWMDY